MTLGRHIRYLVICLYCAGFPALVIGALVSLIDEDAGFMAFGLVFSLLFSHLIWARWFKKNE